MTGAEHVRRRTPARVPSTAELLAATVLLGGEVRLLLQASVTTAVDTDALSAALKHVRSATEVLAQQIRPINQLPPFDDLREDRRLFHPVTGAANPLAMPLAIEVEDGAVTARTRMSRSYEGAPTYLHGGVASLMLDQLLGHATIAAGRWGMTVRLEIAYKRPVPLEVDLVLRAWIVDVAGSRTTVAGSIAAESNTDEVLVQAEGTFVSPSEHVMQRLFSQVVDAAGEPVWSAIAGRGAEHAATAGGAPPGPSRVEA